MIGGDVTDGEPASGAQNPVKLGQRKLLAREDAERALAERGVERAVRERQLLGVAACEADAVAEAGGVGGGLRGANRLGRALDTCRDAAEIPPGEDRGRPDPGGDVEQPVARTQPDQLECAPRRSLAPRVELTAEKPLDRGARVGDGAGFGQVELDSDLLTSSR